MKQVSTTFVFQQQRDNLTCVWKMGHRNMRQPEICLWNVDSVRLGGQRQP